MTDFRAPRDEEPAQVPAVQKGTAGWVLVIENKDTGKRFMADLGSAAPDVLPSTEDAYRMLPVFRLIAQRARAFAQRLTDICVDDLTARNATERRVGDTLYKVERESEWQVDAKILRDELVTLCNFGGELTLKEIDDALPEIVTYAVKANNAKLNSLEKKRGGAIAETIAKHRRRVDGTTRIVEKA